MKIIVCPPQNGEPFEIDVAGTSQIFDVKDTIARQLGCSSSMFDLSCKGNLLWISSSIEENGIIESDSLMVIPVAAESVGRHQLQDNINQIFEGDDPVGLNETYVGSNFEATLEEFGIDFSDNINFDEMNDGLMGPSMANKLILPDNFEGSTLLDQTHIHHFGTAAQVALKIGNDLPSWVNKLDAYAVLANPHLFCVHGINDFTHRRHGCCVLVSSAEYGEHVLQGPGYKRSDASTVNVTLEKPKKQYKIASGITLDRYEINGDLWTRRRLVLTGDTTFSFVQWLHTRSKKKNTIKSEVSSINECLKKMNNTLETITGDMKIMGAKVNDMESGLQENQALCASMSSVVNHLNISVNALLARLPQLLPSDVDNTTDQ